MKFLMAKFAFILVVLFAIGMFAELSFAQRIAFFSSQKNEQSKNFLETLANSLERKFKLIDESLTANLFKTDEIENPYNLSSGQTKNLGTRIGCNFIVLIKIDTLRRSSFERSEYYESSAAIYLVSSRTGRLVFWTLKKFEEDTPQLAKTNLFASIPKLSDEIETQIEITNRRELNEEDISIEEVPISDSLNSKNVRPPLPFRRLKPKYTQLASLYNVVATIDALVDIDAEGNVGRIEIVRWAGYGLDESVEATVRKMNWRPADRNGKKIPMRILLRYNFKNIETEQ